MPFYRAFPGSLSLTILRSRPKSLSPSRSPQKHAKPNQPPAKPTSRYTNSRSQSPTSSQSPTHRRMSTTPPVHDYKQVPEIKKVSTIGTHSGAFHSDEAMAIALLQVLPEFADAKIFRSRDQEFLETLDILVDVGSVYDPEKLRFDHHQREFQETFSPKFNIRLSSAGLIYKHYGMAVIKHMLSNSETLFPAVPSQLRQNVLETFQNDPTTYDLVYNKIYKRLILSMDGVDNGVQQYPANITPAYTAATSLEHRIGRLNPQWFAELYRTPEESAVIKQLQIDNIESMDQFKIAISLCHQEFLHQVQDVLFGFLAARSIVVDALNDRLNHDPSGRIIVSKQFCPWKGHFFDLLEENIAVRAKDPQCTDDYRNVLFFVYPSGSSWRYLAVPETPSSFTIKVKFPTDWMGLRDAVLEDVTGVTGATPAFIHHSGFTGGAATKEALMAILNGAIKYHDEQVKK